MLDSCISNNGEGLRKWRFEKKAEEPKDDMIEGIKNDMKKVDLEEQGVLDKNKWMKILWVTMRD